MIKKMVQDKKKLADVDADAHTYAYQRKKDKHHLQTRKWRLHRKWMK